jgi:DNA-binding NtrC family response regulator
MSIDHVIIADDEPNVRAAIARIFTRRGWIAHEASNACELMALLEASEENFPRAIVCDVEMGPYGATAFADAFRFRFPDRHPTIVFHSGAPVSAATRNRLATIATAILQKPESIAVIERVARSPA